MPLIEIPRGTPSQQVEFPENKKGGATLSRSRAGSLHISPGIRVVTVDELNHIKATNPRLYSAIRVVALTQGEREEAIKGL